MVMVELYFLNNFFSLSKNCETVSQFKYYFCKVLKNYKKIVEVIEISYLNNRHEQVVEEYIKDLKKLMYYSTEDVADGKYQDFLEIMSSVYLYSNNFYDSMLKKEDNGILAEFLFLIPNMMFYTAIGFLTALKDDDNYREMGKYLEQIASITENTTSEPKNIKRTSKC